MKTTKKIAKLRVTRFRYTSNGQCHGVISDSTRLVGVTRILSDTEAAAMGKQGLLFDVGLTTERFANEVQLRTAAIDAFRKDFPESVLLVEENASLYIPCQVLAGRDSELVARLNKLWAEWYTLNCTDAYNAVPSIARIEVQWRNELQGAGIL